MGAIEDIKNRRSIRKFKSRKVDDDIVTQILEAGCLAPSGSNSQPWKFLVVRSEETKSKLAQGCFNQSFIAQASFAIVLLGDFKTYRKRIRRAKELLDCGAVEPRNDEEFTKGYKEQVLSNQNEQAVITANCMLAGENMVIAAQALGLGSCWITLLKQQQLCELFSLPKHLFVVAVISVGYPDQQPKQRPRYELKDIAWNEKIGEGWNL